jgi:hypothetical protein
MMLPSARHSRRTVARFIVAVVAVTGTVGSSVALATPASAQTSLRYVALADSYGR